MRLMAGRYGTRVQWLSGSPGGWGALLGQDTVGTSSNQSVALSGTNNKGREPPAVSEVPALCLRARACTSTTTSGTTTTTTITTNILTFIPRSPRPKTPKTPLLLAAVTLQDHVPSPSPLDQLVVELTSTRADPSDSIDPHPTPMSP
ncbi:hypothetical protein G7046_g4180 [Stylonectria norvegica]|nr:hypothetical protein G7046_g4180 [Stylonectria norvegica]